MLPRMLMVSRRTVRIRSFFFPLLGFNLEVTELLGGLAKDPKMMIVVGISSPRHFMLQHIKIK